MEKKKEGRPTKLTDAVIEILNAVVDNAIYCTDEDLLFLLNDRLPEDDRIATQTFKEYKSGVAQSDNPLMKEFSYLIKKALIREKIALAEELKKGQGNWQSKAWILERKFNEWNLKQLTEIEQHQKIIFQNLSNEFEIDESGESKEK